MTVTTDDWMVAVDLGQTQRRLRVVDRRGQTVLDAVRPSRLALSPLDQLADLLTTELTPPGPPGRAVVVACGMTGVHGEPPDPAPLLRRLAGEFGVREVILADDSVTSYLGTLGSRAGIVCAAGTGVVVLASDGRARHARVDGWGQFAGDLGGGLWIGRQGITAAFLALDGRAGGSRELLARVESTLGKSAQFAHWSALHPVDAVPAIAEFAPQVMAAATDGDSVARAICSQAAHYLADAITAAGDSVSLARPAAVGLAGRLFSPGTPLLSSLRQAVEHRLGATGWFDSGGNSLEGALLLARDPPPESFAPLVRRADTEECTDD